MADKWVSGSRNAKDEQLDEKSNAVDVDILNRG